MVDVTIKTSFECGESRTKTMGPCDLAVCVGVSQRGHGCESRVILTGGKGLRVDSVINSLADAAVDVLLETLEDSRERQARVLKAYMERFIDAAVRKAGTSVMDKVAEQIKKDF
jgi:hypothetical protein